MGDPVETIGQITTHVFHWVMSTKKVGAILIQPLIREADTSRHIGGSIIILPETSRYKSQQNGTKGFEEALTWAPFCR